MAWRRRRPGGEGGGGAAAAGIDAIDPAPTPPRPPLSSTSCSSSPSDLRRGIIGFFLLGLANNSPYTIALAAANELAEGAVGSVFLAAVLPSLLLKLTTPFWFAKVPVSIRAGVSATMGLVAFPLLAAATRKVETTAAAPSPPIKASSVLASIALLSLQGGLGEASTLAHAGAYPRPRPLLGAWSSGTGAAGPVGFSFLILFHTLARLSLRTTVLLALVWPLLWILAHFAILKAPPRHDAEAAAADEAVIVIDEGSGGGAGSTSTSTAAAAAPRAPAVGELELSPREVSIPDRRVSAPFAAVSAEAEEGRRRRRHASEPPQPLSSMSASSPRRPLSSSSPHRAAAAAKAAIDPEEAAGLLEPRVEEEEGARGGGGDNGGEDDDDEERGRATTTTLSPPPPSQQQPPQSHRLTATSLPSGPLATSAHALSLWPFVLPLFLVYFFEYVLQAGVWSSIGGPQRNLRDRFYKSAGWSYQMAVFLSRTFGGLLRLSEKQLWWLPLGQSVLLGAFVAVAVSPVGQGVVAPRILPFPLLLIPAFVVGLLGGLAYVATFTLIAESIPFVPLRSLSLAIVSVADSAGIALADGVSILVQGCLFRAGGFAAQASFKCGAA